MKTAIHRAYAERCVREVFAAAETRGATARETRRMLRARLATLTVGRATWYAAAVKVAGCGLLELGDFRQPELIARGPRRRTNRKKVARG